jgi:RHH-type proline utilization regulon transcriptional repressor/proline dehydrogenase/delta 1-pyrroline-5-carboxylate dehydrogenase
LFVSGARLDPIVRDPRVASVAFTGSTQAARTIGVALAGRIGPFARFIAETGGYNIMLVDETAQLDAACQDILESAFNMSGQRCSALRCAWIDERIFDPLMAKLQGALRARSLGDPTRDIHADFGPLIDAKSASEAEARLERMLSKEGHVLCARALRPDGLGPAYFAPAIVECRQENLALEEIFAPILQTTRFKQGEELRLMDPAAQGGYGLTFGIQTRKPKAAEEWALKFPAGNIYVNRPIIGATVASQPFGGEGLSGTGPKIGGSRYVEAFCHERALSNNSAAFGGCVDLLGDGETSLHRFFK